MMAPAPAGDASFLGIQRRLASALRTDTEGWLEAPRALELSTLGAQDAPRLIAATLLEDRALGAHRVDEDGPTQPRFAAFLDGTQTSRVLAHVDSIPIVHGVVAAVIRHRLERRMRTWDAPRIGRALYAPLRLLSATWLEALGDVGLPVVDTLAHGEPESTHPYALQDAAIHAVQAAREAAERDLAEAWCVRGGGELFVDGAISGSEAVATSEGVIGVVKSHRTLYADGDALRCVLRLRRGERTSVFRVTSPKRTPVASWYLRVRDATGRDPMWGLVRVEVAERTVSATRPRARRADEVSRWVLAEALPLSVPDARWDKMVYGIRDCEEFLRAVQ